MKVLSIGMFVTDIVITLREIPSPGVMNYVSKENHAKISKNLGGHAAIFATDMVKLGLHENYVGVVGALGNDENGEFLRNQIESLGIQGRIQKTDVETSENIILAVEGEDKRYDLYPGANLALDKDFVLDFALENEPEVVYCCAGYTGIDCELDFIFEKLKNKCDSYIFLDIVDPYDKPQNFILPAFPYVDAFKANEEEACHITGEADLERASNKILEQGIESAFLTKGAEGIEYRSNRFKISQPPLRVESVDQTGCGDAFTAGIVYKILNEGKKPISMDSEQLSKILAYGQAVGALASTKGGATTAVSGEGVEKLLSKQGKEVVENTVIKNI